MSSWRTAPLAVVDVEGNGQSPPEIVEISVVILKGDTLADQKTWLVKLERPINWRAKRIHGISNESVSACRRFTDVEPEIRKQLDDVILVGHNVHVEEKILRRQLVSWEPRRTIDTLQLARKYLPECDSYGLTSLTSNLPQLRADPRRVPSSSLRCCRNRPTLPLPCVRRDRTGAFARRTDETQRGRRNIGLPTRSVLTVRHTRYLQKPQSWRQR